VATVHQRQYTVQLSSQVI